MYERTDIWANIATEVKSRRKKLRLTQADLAALAGVSTKHIYEIEHHKRSVQLDKLLDVLEVLGSTLEVARFDDA